MDFDALDEEPVDLIFLLLAPEHAGADHLKALARISRLLREPQSMEKLRAPPRLDDEETLGSSGMRSLLASAIPASTRMVRRVAWPSPP